MIEINVIKWNELKEQSQNNLQKRIDDEGVFSTTTDAGAFMYGDNSHHGVVLINFVVYEKLAPALMRDPASRITFILHDSIVNQDEVKKKIESILRNRAFW